MKLFDRIREYLKRHDDLSAGRDPVWDDTPTAAMPVAAEDAPTITYAPHGIDTPEKLAEIRAQAEADARAAHESAETGPRGEWDDPAGPAPLVPAHDPPPMPPSELSRAMVSQIPDPPVNDRNFGWRHDYADYLRRVGVATGTTTDLEHTMAWGMPALKPGDGSGIPLAGQEHSETDPEVAA